MLTQAPRAGSRPRNPESECISLILLYENNATSKDIPHERQLAAGSNMAICSKDLELHLEANKGKLAGKLCG